MKAYISSTQYMITDLVGLVSIASMRWHIRHKALSPLQVYESAVGCLAELMRFNPGPAMQAMGIHNALLRKAVGAHAGHVIEQEGDSWSVAFHRPLDAVAFSLQVHLWLNPCHDAKQPWFMM